METTANTTAVDHSTRTPPEIDTELADLHTELSRVNARIGSELDTIHSALGERKQYHGRGGRYTWPTSHHDAVMRAREMDPASRAGNYAALTWGKAVADYDALMAGRYTLMAAINVLDTEYQRRPWSRFFLVQNNNGHIHSSMGCQTCHRTTLFGWLPELSGLTEADAVAAHGPLLCTVCYPSAPVEWTVGKPRPAACEGSGKSPVAGSVNRKYRTAWATCTGCDTRQQLNTNGTIRRHKPTTASA